MKSILIIFIKNPQLGKVKTRLAASIGDPKALDIYKKLLHYTHTVTQQLPYGKVVFYSEFIDTDDIWDNDSYQKRIQKGSDLGQRMLHAFSEYFKKGYDSICIIGSDSLELTETIIHEAFMKLRNHDMVLGPSKDGGYYLLGMRSLYSYLFQNKKWSSSSVFEDTLNEIKRHKLTFDLLPLLSDIDRKEDLETLGKRSVFN